MRTHSRGYHIHLSSLLHSSLNNAPLMRQNHTTHALAFAQLLCCRTDGSIPHIDDIPSEEVSPKTKNDPAWQRMRSARKMVKRQSSINEFAAQLAERHERKNTSADSHLHNWVTTEEEDERLVGVSCVSGVVWLHVSVECMQHVF